MQNIVLLLTGYDYYSQPDYVLYILNHLYRNLIDANIYVKFLGELRCSVDSEDPQIMKIQFYIEKKLAQKVNVDRKTIINELLEIKEISENMCDEIVINLTPLTSEEIFKHISVPYVWTIIYNQKNIFSISHIGEKEIVNHEATIDISIVQYDTTGNSYIIDVAKHGIHFAGSRNYYNIIYSLHYFLIKNIKDCNHKRCYSNDMFSSDANGIYKCMLYTLYIYHFYQAVIRKLYHTLTNLLFGTYNEKWHVLLAKGNILDEGLKNLCILPRNPKEFWADPFLYRNNDGRLYLFVERFDYREKKGIIACCELDNDYKVLGFRDVINKPYHLSFPHIISRDNEIFMIPECSANKRLEVYKSVDFPDVWELYSTSLDGLSIVDSIYFTDKNGDNWLFCSITEPETYMHCTVMNIYKVDSLKFRHIVPHYKNPVIMDVTRGRNGGNIFIKDGRCYRVAQNSSFGTYGRGLSIREIKELTLYNYIEEEVLSIDTQTLPDIQGIHQLCQIDGLFAVDVK